MRYIKNNKIDGTDGFHGLTRIIRLVVFAKLLLYGPLNLSAERGNNAEIHNESIRIQFQPAL